MHLAWIEQIQYLGVYVTSVKSCKDDTSTMRRNFFASVNGILSKCLKASDTSKFFLCKTHSLPILMYVIESIYFPMQ